MTSTGLLTVAKTGECRIQEKLGVDSNQALVVWAVRHGLLDDVVVGE